MELNNWKPLRRENEVTRMEHWKDCPEVERRPGKLHGAWAFAGTRVPVAALFENLESGATVEQFLAWFPGVKKWQVKAVLQHEAKALRASGPS